MLKHIRTYLIYRQNIYIVIIIIAITIIFPVMKFFRGNFAETTNGKICLLIPLEQDQVHSAIKKRI